MNYLLVMSRSWAGTNAKKRYNRSMGRILLFTSLIWVLSDNSWGMVTPKSIKDYRTKDYLTEGAFIGGESGKGFTLLNVKRQATRSGKLERIIFEIGDHEGRELSGKEPPGFFHVQIQKNPARVIVDFSQMQKSSVDNLRLQEIFRQSNLIKDSTIVMDPTDGSTNISFALNQPVKVLTFQDNTRKYRTTQITIDLIRQRSPRQKVR